MYHRLYLEIKQRALFIWGWQERWSSSSLCLFVAGHPTSILLGRYMCATIAKRERKKQRKEDGCKDNKEAEHKKEEDSGQKERVSQVSIGSLC